MFSGTGESLQLNGDDSETSLKPGRQNIFCGLPAQRKSEVQKEIFWPGTNDLNQLWTQLVDATPNL
jgi:hypothetical protein